MEQIYKFPELKALATEQGYKLAALEDSQGKRIQPFNKPTIKIEKQFSTIQNRLKNNLFPEGVYYVLLAHNINRAKEPDRYTIAKGRVKNEAQIQTPNLSERKESAPAVLTYDSALKMQKEIAELQSEKRTLMNEKASLEARIRVLEEELSQPLEEQTSGIKTFIEEGMPSVMPIIDRYFDVQEKKLALEEKRLSLHDRVNKKEKPQFKRLIPGSKEHLTLIETLYNNGNDEKMNAELDKLEKANKELYLKVCKELGFEMEEETEEEIEEEGGENE